MYYIQMISFSPKSNSNASKYLKNEKEVIFSENLYVLYTNDIIFTQTA